MFLEAAINKAYQKDKLHILILLRIKKSFTGYNSQVRSDHYDIPLVINTLLALT